MTRPKSKTIATWLALLGGAVGLHRFYLHGKDDVPGWLLVVPTVLGAYGVFRARHYGLDDRLSWALIPLLGFALAGTMLNAIVYGLMSDERWAARFNKGAAQHSGWPAIVGVLLALTVGATVLMATLAFTAQRYFEYAAEPEAQANNRSPTQ